ncbi:hypothetical protein HYPSUDRAFT_347562 [Hypholoma sublateritium FD-334 SS-4]|uniref:Cytochrome P450 n=1 Tax=Hypholoma sublateritium (strain FD-334 SS-4) TaxID=945553 RepID=A0A0D2LEU4_HYPSF|nr:hypothetical protein HYPSUDRAFT_347562 [Hypholoma sublateritium FD-334 SS-4]
MEMLYTLLAVILVAFLLRTRIKQRNRAPLPPGPAGYPVIGNLLELPHSYPWLEYASWAKRYGGVLSFKVFGRPAIIVSSAKAATELFEKRSTNYSDRPRMIMSDELMEWEWNFIHMPYTDRWRRHRRMFHQYFQPRKLSEYYPSQSKMTIGLLDQLSRSPDNFASHIRQYVSSIVLKAAYGYDVQPENDFYVNLAYIAMEPLSHAVHENYLVEFIPLLKHIPDWFPGAGFKRMARDGAKKSRDLRDIPFHVVKDSMANGSAEQSFVCDHLEELKIEGASNVKEVEDTIRNCAGIIYLAGSDTTAALMLAWVLAMAQYPEVQKRAQTYVDGVTGKMRLPEFSDRNSLPYIEAILLETMRWHPIVPLAAPHRVIEDDEYEGYRIPAGATIIANTWYALSIISVDFSPAISLLHRAILHDEEVYPEPSKFNPDRFLQNESVSFELQPDPNFSFGYGRRYECNSCLSEPILILITLLSICPGRHLAMNSAWIAVVSILATYNISKAVDDNGDIIEPKAEFTDGLVSHPKPFKVQITPRSNEVHRIITSAKAFLAS